MLDVMLCYAIVVNMKHAGYLAIAANFLRSAKGRCRGIRAVALRWNKTATAANGTQTSGRVPLVCWTQEDWIQGLARLDSYVASMR